VVLAIWGQRRDFVIIFPEKIDWYAGQNDTNTENWSKSPKIETPER
jgi:hypothetical protein